LRLAGAMHPYATAHPARVGQHLPVANVDKTTAVEIPTFIMVIIMIQNIRQYALRAKDGSLVPDIKILGLKSIRKKRDIENKRWLKSRGATDKEIMDILKDPNKWPFHVTKTGTGDSP